MQTHDDNAHLHRLPGSRHSKTDRRSFCNGTNRTPLKKMPPLVRRRPLLERIQAYLDPWDFLLWISEELQDDAREETLNNWATPIGITLNAVFIVARGASKTSGSNDLFGDDVFADFEGKKSSGWFAWVVSIPYCCAMLLFLNYPTLHSTQATFLVHSLTILCCLNAFYTFFRKRHYRLFQQPVDVPPNTPSAQRVRVDSSPASSYSPVSYIKNVIAAAAPSARAYPDPEREVWEVSVWDPKPFHLTTFTFFSPGHVLLYYALLPTAPLDPRPSVTVVMAVLFGAVLSLQLGFMKTSFTQQTKDLSLIHGQVMNEYDTKFVQPFMTRPVRDVGTQSRESSLTPRGTRVREVDLYTPTTLVNRGFKTNPNTNYASQYDPDNLASRPDPRREPRQSLPPRSTTTPSVATPRNYINSYTQPSTAQHSSSDYSSPLKPRHERAREAPSSVMRGDGGNMGVHSHANSPLRKATSSGHLQSGDTALRRGSPLKRMSTASAVAAAVTDDGESYWEARRTQTGRF